MVLLLAPEILDHIFSFLQLDHATLKTCSQASSVLSPLVEPHLYAQITAYNPDGPDTFTEFTKLLSDNPYIANYVRSLTIMIPGSGIYLLNDDVILNNLPKLTRLEMITLNGFGIHERTSWDNLSRKFQVAFTNCLQLPSMRYVALQNIWKPPFFILGKCRTMKGLFLDGVVWNYSPCFPNSRLSLSGLPELDSLSIIRYNYHPQLIAWAETSNLRSLSFQIGSIDDCDNLLQILEHNAKSLTHFEIELFQKFGNVYDVFTGMPSPPTDLIPINLSILPHLEQLTIRASITPTHIRQFSCLRDLDDEVEYLSYESPLPAIVKFLESSPPLKKLTLRLDLHFIGTFSLWDIDWSPLTYLGNIFPSLRPINLCLSATEKHLYKRVSMRCSDVRSLVLGEPVLGEMARQKMLVVKTEEFPLERIRYLDQDS